MRLSCSIRLGPPRFAWVRKNSQAAPGRDVPWRLLSALVSLGAHRCTWEDGPIPGAISSAIFRHNEDQARQGRTYTEGQHKSAYEFQDRSFWISTVVDQVHGAIFVDEAQDERECKSHCNAHYRVAGQLQNR